MKVLDASAVLAFLQDDPGSARVESELDGGVISAANWSEVAQKVRAAGADWAIARGLLRSYSLRIEPVNEDNAEAAAALWHRGLDCRSLTDCVWRLRIDVAYPRSRLIARGASRSGSCSFARN